MILEKLKEIPVILGSQSPRRKELLNSLDIEFEVEIRETDEYIDRSLPALQVVASIAQNKLAPFLEEIYSHKLVIVADTLVADSNGFLIGKPKDIEEAKSVLAKLSGNTHIVYTAVAISYQGKVQSFVEETKVQFTTIDKSEIDYYVGRYRPMDKAGSYGIQEWIGRMGIHRIEGSYENVVGLPTARLYQELKNILLS